MVLIAISVTLSMAAIVIRRMPALPATPYWISRWLHGTLGKVLCLAHFYPQVKTRLNFHAG